MGFLHGFFLFAGHVFRYAIDYTILCVLYHVLCDYELSIVNYYLTHTVFICVCERVFGNDVRPKPSTVDHATARPGIWIALTLKLPESATSLVPPLITLSCKNQHWLKTDTPMRLQNPGFCHID